MSEIIKLLVNDSDILQFDRGISLPSEQLNYLDAMDSKMSKGITMSGIPVLNPDLMQKTQFVASNMLDYISDENFNQAIALFSYIVYRNPDLKQVKAEGKSKDYKIELIFDEDLLTEKPQKETQWQEVKFS